MIHLRYYPGTAEMVPHTLLEEIGAPYERMLARPAVLLAGANERHAAPFV